MDDEPRGRGKALFRILVLVALALIAAVVYFTRAANDTQTERDSAVSQTVDIAGQVSAACAAGKLTGPLCTQAAAAAAQPIPGEAGKDGRGITGTAINPAGELVVTFSDGTSQVVGAVVGKPGAAGTPGAAGAVGRSITGTLLQAGRLVVTFSDGTSDDVGAVVGADGQQGQTGFPGADGRGVAEVGQVDGRLVVTYTDGSTQDAGPLPQGKDGVAGADGQDAKLPDRIVKTYPDSTVETCVRSGGDDAAPTYACDRTSAVPDTPDPGEGTLGGG